MARAAMKIDWASCWHAWNLAGSRCTYCTPLPDLDGSDVGVTGAWIEVCSLQPSMGVRYHPPWRAGHERILGVSVREACAVSMRSRRMERLNLVSVLWCAEVQRCCFCGHARSPEHDKQAALLDGAEILAGKVTCKLSNEFRHFQRVHASKAARALTERYEPVRPTIWLS